MPFAERLKDLIPSPDQTPEQQIENMVRLFSMAGVPGGAFGFGTLRSGPVLDRKLLESILRFRNPGAKGLVARVSKKVPPSRFGNVGEQIVEQPVFTLDDILRLFDEIGGS